MKNVTRLTSPKVSDIEIKRTVEDPRIVKVAKLALILADHTIDDRTKLLSIKACERMGYITETEASQLIMYKSELVDFIEDDDEEEEN